MSAHNRAQAFTLEALIGSILLLTALLFASQAIVIAPDSAGELDRSVQEERIQIVEDALAVGAENGDLSRLARYFNDSGDPFPAGDTDQDGYASDTGIPRAAGGRFGRIIHEEFNTNRYNVELIYRDGSGNTSTNQVTRVVYQGEPRGPTVSVSRTVVLYEDQTFTAPGNSTTNLTGLGTDEYPIPNISSSDPNADEVYNVVEVRITIW
jgi:hypothetical protein